MTSRSCNRCDAEAAPTTLASAAGSDDPLTVTVRNMPVVACSAGHRQFVRATFAAELLDHLTQQDEPELPAGEEKGLIRKRFLCESCGAELAPKPDHRHTFSIDVSLDKIDPFAVELTMPVYRCTACDTEQLHSLKELRKHTPQALAEAFKAADIPPG